MYLSNGETFCIFSSLNTSISKMNGMSQKHSRVGRAPRRGCWAAAGLGPQGGSSHHESHLPSEWGWGVEMGTRTPRLSAGAGHCP